VKRNSNN